MNDFLCGDIKMTTQRDAILGYADDQHAYYIRLIEDNIVLGGNMRLKAIKEFTEFGSGFKIAMRDLEIRGAGSMLGEIQSGHMEQVGYDTYCKLLDEVVREMQGTPVKEEKDVKMMILEKMKQSI